MTEDLQAQLIRDLVVESFEGLEQFDRELLSMEDGSACEETLHNAFRIVHTLKGTSGCLGLHCIERAAHVGENLLALMREGRMGASPEVISALFSYSDALRGLLKDTSGSGGELPKELSALLESMQGFNQSRNKFRLRRKRRGLKSSMSRLQRAPTRNQPNSPRMFRRLFLRTQSIPDRSDRRIQRSGWTSDNWTGS